MKSKLRAESVQSSCRVRAEFVQSSCRVRAEFGHRTAIVHDCAQKAFWGEATLPLLRMNTPLFYSLGALTIHCVRYYYGVFNFRLAELLILC